MVGPNDSIMRSPLEKSPYLRTASVRTILLLKGNIQVFAVSMIKNEYYGYYTNNNCKDNNNNGTR